MHRPNIIFVLIDDMGWKDLGCYGSSFYETPNLDRLASEGVLFTDAYAAAPVCSPTRASILSGKYPARVGVTNFIGASQTRGKLLDAPYVDHLPLEEKSIAAALRETGYATWHVGKWHLGGRPYYPENHGFDVNVGGCDWGHPMYGYYSPYGIETMPDGPDGEYLTDRLTNEAIGLVKRHQERTNGQPFFLYLSHYAVHTPIQGKRDLLDKYIQKAKKMGLDRVNALEQGGFFPSDHKKSKRIVRRRIQSDVEYAAMVENLDENIGRLLNAVKVSGLSDNTVIFFTSDNGGLSTAEGSPTSNAPLSEGKGWMYEGGLREPLIVKWPGVTKPGSVCTVPVTSPDFFPTFLEMAGQSHNNKRNLDGTSLVPLLRGETQLNREAIFWHFPHYANQGGTPGSSVREGDYKLIEFYEDGRLELFNLRTDIGECRNCVSECAEVAESLHQKLVKWRGEIEAILPSPIAH